MCSEKYDEIKEEIEKEDSEVTQQQTSSEEPEARADEANNEANNIEDNKNTKDDTEKIDSIKALLEDKTRQCDEYFDKLQRVAAEFDNYKKRTAKEKDSIYNEAVADTVAVFLPVIDSIDRAIKVCSDESLDGAVKEGIKLIKRQFEESMKNLGVEEIKSVGEPFDPEFHNAVMHVEDDKYGNSEVIEEFQKGYKMKDRVIRHSMVKVAN